MCHRNRQECSTEWAVEKQRGFIQQNGTGMVERDCRKMVIRGRRGKREKVEEERHRLSLLTFISHIHAVGLNRLYEAIIRELDRNLMDIGYFSVHNPKNLKWGGKAQRIREYFSWQCCWKEDHEIIAWRKDIAKEQDKWTKGLGARDKTGDVIWSLMQMSVC